MVALAAVAILACGSDVALGNPSDTIVSVTVYKSGGQQTTESITSGSLSHAPGSARRTPAASHAGVQPEGARASGSLGSTAWTLSTILNCLQQPIGPATPRWDHRVQRDGCPQPGDDSTLRARDLVPPTNFDDPNDSPVVTGPWHVEAYDRPWRGGNDENFLTR